MKYDIVYDKLFKCVDFYSDRNDRNMIDSFRSLSMYMLFFISISYFL